MRREEGKEDKTPIKLSPRTATENRDHFLGRGFFCPFLSRLIEQSSPAAAGKRLRPNQHPYRRQNFSSEKKATQKTDGAKKNPTSSKKEASFWAWTEGGESFFPPRRVAKVLLMYIPGRRRKKKSYAIKMQIHDLEREDED